MKILCATSIPFAAEVFGPLGELQILDPHKIIPAVVKDADILIARSTLKVNKGLLEGSRVKFVGTCTIGYDHVDAEYLEQKGITWTAAPGCNANSVAEYVTCALLALAKRHRFCLRDKTIGIIGVGNVGSLVVKKSEALGMRVLLNDPPLLDAMEARADHFPQTVAGPRLACQATLSAGQARCLPRLSVEAGEAGSTTPPTTLEIPMKPIYSPLEEALKADIITTHVPLTKEGKYPTFHLANRDFFAKLKPGCLFINSARGAVMNSDDFLKARAGGIVAHTVIDCWEGEPAFRPDVMKAADIATPHIAGYSFEGRSMGTIQVYNKLCAFLGIQPKLRLDDLLPPPPVPEINFDAAGMPDEEALANIVRRVYDIEADDSSLRESACADAGKRGKNFEKMRRNYHLRREFRYTRVINVSAALAETLGKLEFQVVSR